MMISVTQAGHEGYVDIPIPPESFCENGIKLLICSAFGRIQEEVEDVMIISSKTLVICLLARKFVVFTSLPHLTLFFILQIRKDDDINKLSQNEMLQVTFSKQRTQKKGKWSFA